MSIYNITVKDAKGNDVSLKNYKGKVLLIVNTATECGFTPQYEYLQALYSKYEMNGLEILDFPCNQFANQAPGSEDEIHAFCTSRFGVTFPLFKKIDVNGENADELYKWLTSNTKFNGFDMNHKLGVILDNLLKDKDPDYASKSDIKWNFTKFLIDQKGNIVKRFEPTCSKEDIESEVVKLLGLQ